MFDLLISLAEPSEVYYMLCDALPEDKDLRMKLQQQRLVRNYVNLWMPGKYGCKFKVITWTNIDQWCHIGSLYHNELMEYSETCL